MFYFWETQELPSHNFLNTSRKALQELYTLQVFSKLFEIKYMVGVMF